MSFTNIGVWCFWKWMLQSVSWLKIKWHGQNICKTYITLSTTSQGSVWWMRCPFPSTKPESWKVRVLEVHSGWVVKKVWTLHSDQSHFLIYNIIWVPRHLVSSKCTWSSGVPRTLMIWKVIIALHIRIRWVRFSSIQPNIIIQRAH